MAKKLYIADRDFDHFSKGEVVELEDDDPYTRTGYLEEWTPAEPAAAAEEPPALDNTTDETPETGADGAAPVGEEGTPSGDADTGRTGRRARSGGRG